MAAPLAAPLAARPDGAVAHHPQRARVTFAGGLLDVRANDSSLNGILREISRATGMKLTGGVAEQRVFGNYGPATPATVLATLLDGTGSNMVLRENADRSPAELILTQRNGGPSPPAAATYADDPAESVGASPSAGIYPAARIYPSAAPTDDTGIIAAGRRRASLPPGGLSGPPSLGQPINNVNGSPDNTSPTAATLPTTNSVPLDSVPTPPVTPAVSGIVDAPNPPPPGTTTSPAGATETTPAAAGEPKTPEQVYQLLQQLRQKATQQQNAKPQ